jgi:hypothetical protein
MEKLVLPLQRPTILNSEMSSSKKGKQPLTSQSGALIGKLRKPMPPPTRVAPDDRKYSRARERELIRRTVKK